MKLAMMVLDTLNNSIFLGTRTYSPGTTGIGNVCCDISLLKFLLREKLVDPPVPTAKIRQNADEIRISAKLRK